MEVRAIHLLTLTETDTTRSCRSRHGQCTLRIGAEEPHRLPWPRASALPPPHNLVQQLDVDQDYQTGRALIHSSIPVLIKHPVREHDAIRTPPRQEAATADRRPHLYHARDIPLV